MHTKNTIAKVMIVGVLIPAVIIATGTAYFLFYHWRDMPRYHLFHGEPLHLRKPLDILLFAFKGSISA